MRAEKNFSLCPFIHARRAFTLAEVLVGLSLLAAALLMLAAGERWLLLVSARSSRRLLARDRGQRVIAFVEPRVLHCGLGFGACRGDGEAALALGKGTSTPAPVPNWDNPALCVWTVKNNLMLPVEPDNGVFKGTTFSVLYSLPSKVIIRTLDSGALTLKPGEEAVFQILKTNPVTAGFISEAQGNFKSWCVLPLSGMPLYISNIIISSGRNRLSLVLAKSAVASVEVGPVNELLFLRCERFHVLNENFSYQEKTRNWEPAAYYPRENGILALWCEWQPARRLFDLSVLASGGPAVFGRSARPVEWPPEAPWLDDRDAANSWEDFGRHELYISRASWKLENL